MNIIDSLKERCFIIPRANFASESQKELVSLIMKSHGEENLKNIRLIDENDDYDSFLIELENLNLCLKMSFDSVPIFYEHMVLKGIEQLELAPQAIDRKNFIYGKELFYTLQTFEYSNNVFSLGNSILLEDSFKDFYFKLKKLHSYEVPNEVHEYLDNTKSFLEYQNLNFDKVISYVDKGEEEIFSFIKNIHSEIYDEMFDFFEKNENKLMKDKFVHGNLNQSTIINNEYQFKFINFENCFLGSIFFDMANLVFELQLTGLKELDFITRRIKDLNFVTNRFKSSTFINEYKICKHIWIRKKLLDIIKEYVKEVIVLNKERTDKLAKLANNFTKHFYKFNGISAFDRNRDLFAQKFSELILDN